MSIAHANHATSHVVSSLNRVVAQGIIAARQVADDRAYADAQMAAGIRQQTAQMRASTDAEMLSTIRALAAQRDAALAERNAAQRALAAERQGAEMLLMKLTQLERQIQTSRR